MKILLGIGAILLAIAAFLALREQSFLSRAESVTGSVTDFSMSSSSDSGTSYCPVIEFTTKGGQDVRYYANVCSSPPAYDIGDQVKVIYDPQNPRQVQIENIWIEYLGALIVGGVGLPFFLLGAWSWFSGLSKKSS
jgi:hypothetical protein